jgi:hypothetical protein
MSPWPALPRLDQIKLDVLRMDQLREAIRNNWVSFPSPVPTFKKHDRPDLQWKLVQLYFVRGWNCKSIADRYGFSRQRSRQILMTWKRRAVEMGYIQYIPPPENLSIAAPIQSALLLASDFLPPSVPHPVFASASAVPVASEWMKTGKPSPLMPPITNC